MPAARLGTLTRRTGIGTPPPTGRQRPCLMVRRISRPLAFPTPRLLVSPPASRWIASSLIPGPAPMPSRSARAVDSIIMTIGGAGIVNNSGHRAKFCDQFAAGFESDQLHRRGQGGIDDHVHQRRRMAIPAWDVSEQFMDQSSADHATFISQGLLTDDSCATGGRLLATTARRTTPP